MKTPELGEMEERVWAYCRIEARVMPSGGGLWDRLSAHLEAHEGQGVLEVGVSERDAPKASRPGRAAAHLLRWTGLAAALLFVFGIVAAVTPVGEALARATGWVQVIVGDLPDAPKGPAEPSYEIVPSPTTLEGLRQEIGYPLYLPSYLPDGTELV